MSRLRLGLWGFHNSLQVRLPYPCRLEVFQSVLSVSKAFVSRSRCGRLRFPLSIVAVCGRPFTDLRIATDDIEMSHHAGGVVLEDVTVIHPAAWAIVRHPRNAGGAPRREIDDVFPREPRRRVPVDREDLEEEAV